MRIYTKCVLSAAMLLLAMPAFAQDYDVIIRNGRVIDGTGNAWFLADVATKGDRIAAIGDLRDKTATTTIDAKKHFVSPGFIDVHAHADYDLYKLQLAENFVRDGVTTIVTGNCGGSPTDVADYFATLKEKGVGLNVATLYGHNTILRTVKGMVKGELTPEQIEEGRQLVHKAMKGGAVGLSTGLIYTPGTWSTTEEIITFNKVAAEYGGIYATHMRSETTEILSAIDEAVQIATESGTRLQISHFKMPRDVAAKIGGSNTTLRKVEEARENGLEVWVDQYPYTASSTTLNVMIPDWVLEKGGDEAKKIVQDADQIPRILAEMKESNEDRRGRKDMSYAVIASSRAYPEFAGRNMKEVAQIFKLRAEKGEEVDWKSIPKDQWPEVTMEEQYRGILQVYVKGGAGCVYHTMDESDVENIMRHPLVGICSDSGVREFGAGVPHPRGYGSNARVLGRYTRERGILRWEDAVRKMTSMPALAFRMADRGILRTGYYADITIFDPETVIDNSTFEDPHHYSTGFTAVLVNGVVVVENDTVTGKLPGMPVLGPGYTATPDEGSPAK